MVLREGGWVKWAAIKVLGEAIVLVADEALYDRREPGRRGDSFRLSGIQEYIDRLKELRSELGGTGEYKA